MMVTAIPAAILVYFVLRVLGLPSIRALDLPVTMPVSPHFRDAGKSAQFTTPQIWAGAINPYPEKPRISFRADGSFKVTIFSDIHFGENPWDPWGPEQDVKTNLLMTTLLDIEQPDYV